jgi:hypothetical protein
MARTDAKNQELRIEHDDDAPSILDAINTLLKPKGLEFVCDNKEHDGFEIYTLTQTTKPAKEN